MGNGMNKVLPGLYIGNVRDSKDQNQLEENRITHVIAIHDTAREQSDSQRQFLCIQAQDSPIQNISQYFSQCNDFIHEARMGRGNVLIHCLAGVSRSVTLAVAYVMAVSDLNSREALKVVQGARHIANPNVGFMRQLQEYEFRFLPEERRRMRRKFPRHSFCTDGSECRKLLQTYHARLPPLSGEAHPGQQQHPRRFITPPSSPARRPAIVRPRSSVTRAPPRSPSPTPSTSSNRSIRSAPGGRRR